MLVRKLWRGLRKQIQVSLAFFFNVNRIRKLTLCRLRRCVFDRVYAGYRSRRHIGTSVFQYHFWDSIAGFE